MISRCSEARERTMNWSERSRERRTDDTTGGYRRMTVTSIDATRTVFSVATGAGLTAAKMKDCRWLKPALVAQIKFLEWTGENHLRHTKFIALRDDKLARDVRRE